MANLRSIVDRRTLEAATPQQDPAAKSYPSPAGKHVASNIQDPYGTTKDELDDLNQAKLNYEMKKAQMQMKLKPVQSVVEGIQQMHEMQDPNQMNPDANMGYSDPNDPMNSGGNPQNMSQQPGAMQTQNPAQMGFQPGVAPGAPKESVRPLKLGMPQPGQAMPGQVAGNPSQQFNPAAPKPAGAGQMPGAKGPGDPKVGNQVKKAQSGSKGASKSGSNSSGGKIAIHVNADSVSSTPAKSPLSSYAGADILRSAHVHTGKEGCCEACEDKIKAYGTSQGVMKEWDSRGRGRNTGKRNVNPEQSRTRGNRPKAYGGNGRGDQPIGPNMWRPWADSHPPTGKLAAYGTSSGVMKEWDSRGRGRNTGKRNVNPEQSRGRGISEKGFEKQEQDRWNKHIVPGKSGWDNMNKAENPGTLWKPRMDKDKLNAYGTSEGVRKEWESRGHGKKEPIVDMDDPRANKPWSERKKSNS